MGNYFLNKVHALIARRVDITTRYKYKGGPSMSELRREEGLLQQEFAEWLWNNFIKEKYDDKDDS